MYSVTCGTCENAEALLRVDALWQILQVEQLAQQLGAFGKGGATIRSIRQETGAGVDLIADIVKITGTQEAVLAAQKIVEKIVADEAAGPGLWCVCE